MAPARERVDHIPDAMKVHLTLTRNARSSPEARELALERLGEVVDLADVNLSRARRFGVVTIEVSPDLVEKLRRLDVVQSVSADEERHTWAPNRSAISGS